MREDASQEGELMKAINYSKVSPTGPENPPLLAS